jgi:asparagine synthetase B (glutamine-hydrolysing)
MSAAKPIELRRPIAFDDAMRRAMKVPPPPKKSKPKKVWRKKKR